MRSLSVGNMKFVSLLDLGVLGVSFPKLAEKSPKTKVGHIDDVIVT